MTNRSNLHQLELTEDTVSEFLNQLGQSRFSNADEFLIHLIQLQQLAWSSLGYKRRNNIESVTEENVDLGARLTTKKKAIENQLVNLDAQLGISETDVGFGDENDCDEVENDFEVSDDRLFEAKESSEDNKFDISTLTCNMCTPPKSFRRQSNLKRHLNFHREEFKCDQCPKRFDRKERLDVHQLKHSRGRKPFVCEICNKAFTRKETLWKHKEQSHKVKPDGYKCNLCAAIFAKSSQRKNHLSSAHPDGMFKCINVDCTSQFRKSSSYNAHLTICRSTNPKYKCDNANCNKVFNNRRLLDQHKSKHNAPGIICAHCGKGYRWLSSYKAHLHAIEKKTADAEKSAAEINTEMEVPMTRSTSQSISGHTSLPESSQNINYSSVARPFESIPEMVRGNAENMLPYRTNLNAPVDIQLNQPTNRTITPDPTGVPVITREGTGQYMPTLH